MAHPQLRTGKAKRTSEPGERIMLLGIADFRLMADGFVSQTVLADSGKTNGNFDIVAIGQPLPVGLIIMLFPAMSDGLHTQSLASQQTVEGLRLARRALQARLHLLRLFDSHGGSRTPEKRCRFQFFVA